MASPSSAKGQGKGAGEATPPLTPVRFSEVLRELHANGFISWRPATPKASPKPAAENPEREDGSKSDAWSFMSSPSDGPVTTGQVMTALEGDSLQPDVEATAFEEVLTRPVDVLSAQLRIQMATLKEIRQLKEDLRSEGDRSRSRSPRQ